jgi:hypothetical protein
MFLIKDSPKKVGLRLFVFIVTFSYFSYNHFQQFIIYIVNTRFIDGRKLGELGLWCLMPLTFNNISVISWPSVLFGGENWNTQRKSQTKESHRQTLSHNVVSSTSCLERKA